MQNVNLFAIIDRAKSLGAYATANLAFACLLDTAIDTEGYKFFWEGELGFRCYAHPNCLEDSYYDLAVVSDGLYGAIHICNSSRNTRVPWVSVGNDRPTSSDGRSKEKNMKLISEDGIPVKVVSEEEFEELMKIFDIKEWELEEIDASKCLIEVEAIAVE